MPFGFSFLHRLLGDVHTPHYFNEIALVGLAADKPAGANAKDNMLYYETDTGLWKRYRSATGNWVIVGSNLTNLSQLTIDADKNWQAKNITNFGAKGYNVGNQLVHGIIFNLGTATVGTKLAQALIPGSFSIPKVILYADNAPTGADLIVDINKNGSTIFTTQANRPKISAGNHSGESGTPNVTSLAKGNRVSVDIDQVGSGVAGGDDLLVAIIC